MPGELKLNALCAAMTADPAIISDCARARRINRQFQDDHRTRAFKHKRSAQLTCFHALRMKTDEMLSIVKYPN
jgi:hypothetical protein